MAKKSIKKNWLNQYGSGTTNAQPTLTFNTMPIGTVGMPPATDNTRTTVAPIITKEQKNATALKKLQKSTAEHVTFAGKDAKGNPVVAPAAGTTYGDNGRIVAGALLLPELLGTAGEVMSIGLPLVGNVGNALTIAAAPSAAWNAAQGDYTDAALLATPWALGKAGEVLSPIAKALSSEGAAAEAAAVSEAAEAVPATRPINLQREIPKPKKTKYSEVIDDPNFEISKNYGTKEAPRDIKIKGKSGTWSATRNPNTGYYNFSASMSSPMESGRAISRMNELLPAKPVILEPHSYSLDSYNALLNMSRRPEWEMEHVGHIDLNNSAIHNNFLKHLTGNQGASSVVNDTRYFKNKEDAEEGLRLVNEFLAKKGMKEKARLSMPFGTKYGLEIPNYKLSRKYEYGGTISNEELDHLGDLVHKIQYLPIEAYGGFTPEEEYKNSLISQDIIDNPRTKFINEEKMHLSNLNKQKSLIDDHSSQIRKIKLINALNDLIEGKNSDDSNKHVFVVEKPKEKPSTEEKEADENDEIEIVYNPKLNNKSLILGKNAADNGIFAAFSDAVSEYKELYPGRPIPRISSGIRTRAEQEQLYANRMNSRYPVAKPGTSLHEKGKAIDIVFDGTETKQDYQNLASLMKKRGVKWLGDYDKVHFEVDPNYPKTDISENGNILLSSQPINTHLNLTYPHTRSFKDGGVINDDMGQWAHPGEVTRIASNNITMKGVPYPVLGVGADGEQRMMYPNEEHTFNQGPVTEYPIMKAQNGGPTTRYSYVLDDNNGNTVFDDNGNPIIIDPTTNYTVPNWLPQVNITAPKVTLEEKINKELGSPQNKAHVMATSEEGDDEVDNVRHSFAGRYTAEGIKNWLTGNDPYNDANLAAQVAGAVGASLFGLGHEASTYTRDPRWSQSNDRYGNPMPWYKRAYTITREGLEDQYNNMVGATIGALPVSKEQKDEYLWNLLDNDQLPDGYGETNVFGPTRGGAYRKNNIQQHERGGVTWLNEYAQGGETFTAGGEKHRVYEKESPTGNGKGVKGHIMVTHPTTDKGKWDTIDLTKIAGAKTVAQGVAATKKWHKENPEYNSKKKLKTRK